MWIITNLKSFNKSTFCLKIYRQNIIKKIKKNHRKACKTYQNLSKEEEEKKRDNIVVNVTVTFQKMNNRSLLSIEKKQKKFLSNKFISKADLNEKT